MSRSSRTQLTSLTAAAPGKQSAGQSKSQMDQLRVGPGGGIGPGLPTHPAVRNRQKPSNKMETAPFPGDPMHVIVFLPGKSQ